MLMPQRRVESAIGPKDTGTARQPVGESQAVDLVVFTLDKSVYSPR